MEKTEKRTAEEILAEHLKKDSVAIHAYGQWTVTSAMNEYAAQELAEYKAKLKEEVKTLRDNGYASISSNYLIDELIDKL